MKSFAAIFVCLLAACVAKKESSSDTLHVVAGSPDVDVLSSKNQIRVTGTITDGSRPDYRMSVDPRPADGSVTPVDKAWLVTANGVGPLRAGMTVAEANKVVGGFSAPSGADPACSYANLKNAPDGLAVMLQNNKIARIEVRSGTLPTAEGARIGDAESRINSLYSGRVTTSAHKYVTGGHYLTITPATDTTHRIVFETDGKVVTNYRAGVLPAVEYVERCG